MTIVTLEERYTYMCNHTQPDRIFWLINDSQLNVDIFPLNVATVINPLPDGGRVYTLTIGGRPEHNATTIQCVANSSDGSLEAAPNVTFLIQGEFS